MEKNLYTNMYYYKIFGLDKKKTLAYMWHTACTIFLALLNSTWSHGTLSIPIGLRKFYKFTMHRTLGFIVMLT